MTRRLRWAALACIVGFFGLLGGCGSNSEPNNDTPVVTSLFPTNATAGGPAFTLNVAGNGFIATSVVYWNNSQRATSFNTTSTELSASITAQDIATAGTAQVTVVTPAPGGGVSTAFFFTINPVQNAVPTITSLSPASTALATLPSGNLLTVNGTNFISNSVLALNGITRSTTFVSATQLTVTLTPADVASNTTIAVTVSNPTPGGGVSTAASFKVGTGSAVRIKSTTAIASAPGLPQVVSLSAAGGASNGASAAPAASADGRYVAFYSTATNLLAQGASGNIFVRDTCVGVPDCTPQTVAVDLAADGGAPNAQAEAQVSISGDGRFVAFTSPATNLVFGSAASSASTSNIYVRDLCLGAVVPADCVPSTSLVSVAADGGATNGHSYSPSISADGRLVSFTSAASNLAATTTSGAGVYVRNTCAGTLSTDACVPNTHLVALTADSAIDEAETVGPVTSANGHNVALEIRLSGGVTPLGGSEIFLAQDTCYGANHFPECTPLLMPVSLSADGAPLSGTNSSPSISADGRFVAFTSTVAGAQPSVFLRDTCVGAASDLQVCTPNTTLLSADAEFPSVSSTGRYISFVQVASPSSASGAATTGTLYIYDTCFGAVEACTPQAYPVATDSAATSSPAPMSVDGSVIVFSSFSAIAGLPLSGQGDILLAVTPF